MSKLTKKYDQQQKKQQILKLISEGKTPQTIATQLKITRRYIDETLKEELASTETPQKILEMRDLQSAQIQTHTPRLAQTFIKTSDLRNKLTDKYIQLVDEADKGQYSYSHIFDQQIMDGLEPDEAHNKTISLLAQYHQEREQLSKEVERISKISDQSYRTYLEQQKRLSQLHGTDTPSQHHIMIARTDQIKIELTEEIKRTQKEIEAQKQNTMPVLEAEEIIEEPTTKSKEKNIDG